MYQPNDDWDIRALGELDFLGARTDQVHTTERKLQLDDAVVQYSEYRAGLQVGYSGFKPFKIIAGAGATIQRNFDFFRVDQSKRTDPAPYLRIAAEAQFFKGNERNLLAKPAALPAKVDGSDTVSCCAGRLVRPHLQPTLLGNVE